MAELLTYSSFYSLPEAQELTDLLKNSNIKFVVVHEKGLLDKIYIGDSIDPMITVKIPEDRFEEVNALLLSKAQSELTDINPDYYLFSFSNQELTDVVNKRDEWNHFDQALALKILSDRKIEVPKSTEISTDAYSYVPLHIENLWIISQYIVAILIPYVGIMIGLATLFAYKTLRSGEKVKMYDAASRQHAIIILVLGVIRTIFLFLTRIFH
jgi:hypothetical protein